jgi:hypothetical protein
MSSALYDTAVSSAGSVSLALAPSIPTRHSVLWSEAMANRKEIDNFFTKI